MARPVDDATRQAWHRRFQRFAKSGHSGVRFCAREGVSVASFYRWRKQWNTHGPRRRRPGRCASFQPVMVVPAAPGVSIHLPCGARIEVRAEDLEALRAVVAELARADGHPHRDGPDLMLADFSGTLLADCYSGYQGITLRRNGRIRRAACVAHARRKVFNVQDAYPLESSLVLAKFQQLYDIED